MKDDCCFITSNLSRYDRTALRCSVCGQVWQPISYFKRYGRQGGKSRWAGVKPAERSKIMSDIRKGVSK